MKAFTFTAMTLAAALAVLGSAGMGIAQQESDAAARHEIPRMQDHNRIVLQ